MILAKWKHQCTDPQTARPPIGIDGYFEKEETPKSCNLSSLKLGEIPLASETKLFFWKDEDSPADTWAEDWKQLNKVKKESLQMSHLKIRSHMYAHTI